MRTQMSTLKRSRSSDASVIMGEGSAPERRRILYKMIVVALPVARKVEVKKEIQAMEMVDMT